MQQSIRYKGLSLTPDDMATENGALSLCGNLELHDGALRPAIVSGTNLSQPLTVEDKVAEILYVHETGNYRHFIAKARYVNNKEDAIAIYWFDKDGSIGSPSYIVKFYSGTINSISSVGNTLVIVSSTGIHYALWKDGDYKYLGEKPPFVNIDFTISSTDQAEDYELGGISGEGSTAGFYESFQQTTYSCGDIYSRVDSEYTEDSYGKSVMNIKEDKQSDITQSIYALLNRANNLIARHGRFYANFFVRYCYRMFDGSMVMHSAPVFIPVMVPDNYIISASNIIFKRVTSDTGASVIHIDWDDNLSFKRADANGNEKTVSATKATFHYRPRNTALYYTLQDYSISELKSWNDIIKSIDIFITPPITKIDTSEKISNLIYCKKEYTLEWGWRTPLVWGWPEKITWKIGWATIDFPSISDDAYRNKLKNSSAFYKVCSLKVSELVEQDYPTELPVDKTAVYQVSLQEQMKDDYKTHNYLIADGSYVYNHRLNLYGVKEKLFAGFGRRSMFPHSEDLFVIGTQLFIEKIVTVLNTTSGKKYVVNNEYTSRRLEALMLANLCKFYPDTRAEKMVFFTYDSSDTKYIYAFDLEACEELNGAMHIGTFEDDGGNPDKYLVSSFDYSVDDVVDMSNKIYTSESDNAFYFPLNGINTVGIGSIQGIASTTRALSQGQFGQYPLMAFSTDGIWALEISSQGTYSSIHPISREVCSNPRSITQLDQSVVFSTNRSLSKIAESQVASMTDVLDGPGFDIANKLSKFLEYFDDAEGDDDDAKAVKAQIRQLIGFTSSPIDFFQTCQVIYDYKNSRIFCLDVNQTTKATSGDTVALCYSVKDGAWSTFLIKDVLTAINSYPHPYIQYRDGSVTVLDKAYDYDEETDYHGIIVSRPLKFDEDECPDAITGYVHSLTTASTPMMWLFGSNDLQNWHYLGRCNRMKSHYMACKSYRYFRIALYLKMKSSSQYLSTRLEVIRRFSKI